MLLTPVIYLYIISTCEKHIVVLGSSLVAWDRVLFPQPTENLIYFLILNSSMSYSFLWINSQEWDIWIIKL